MQRFGAYLLALTLTLFCGSASALDEHLSITQAPDGTVIATLSGDRYPCTYALAGAPAVLVAAGTIQITSQAVGLGCPVHMDDAPVAFEVAATIGALAEGSYVAQWSVSGAASYQVQTRFTVAGGIVAQEILPVGVPVLTGTSAAVLALLVALSGPLLIADRHHRRPSVR